MFFGKCRRNLVFHKLKRATEMMMSMIKDDGKRIESKSRDLSSVG